MTALLDQFHVPMFAVERPASGAPWVLICINTAHAEASGMDKAAVAGKFVRDLLPPEDADWACGRYDQCAASHEPLRYLEHLTIADVRQAWDTSLQWAPLPDGAERVIGTALILPSLPAGAERGTTINIRDYAVEADFHLSRVSAFLESVANLRDIPAHKPGNFESMAGVCRAISSLMHDIRRAVEANKRSPGGWQEDPRLLSVPSSSASSDASPSTAFGSDMPNGFT